MSQTAFSLESRRSSRFVREFADMTYDQFVEYFYQVWDIGQHVAIVGTTGSGKTFVAQDIKLMRNWLVVIATKSKDETLDGYTGFVKRSSWPPEWNEKLVLFWQKPKSLLDLHSIQLAIYSVLNHLYRYGGWTIYFDDLFFVSETLKLKGALRMFYTQVRSSDVSIVASIQRPFWVPVEAMSQSTYCLLFATQDENDIKRVSEGLGVNYRVLLSAISHLQKYEFLLLIRGQAPIIVHRKGVN